MRVTVNNVELRFCGNKPSLELIPENKELGFIAKVEYKNGENEIFRNLKEVHLYYRELRNEFDYDTAFESDIHCTGSTRRSKEIESIFITNAEKVYDSICE